MKIHRFATLLAASTFLLLLVGGLVHGTGSGLACPDWPLCFGSALPKMEGHVLYEHSHRLVAGTVAILAMVLAGAIEVGRRRDRALVRLGFGAVALVLVQAVLGGLTVLLKLPTIVSTAHLATSMLFFSLTLYLVVRAHPGYAPVAAPADRRLVGVATAALYLQILLGGVVRHTGSGLACIDLPLCHGSVLPLGAHPSVVLQAVHRLAALVVAALVIAASVRTLRARPASSLARALAWAAPALVVAQIALGVLSVMSYLELFRVTAHLGVAALLLADLVGLYLVRSSSFAATAAHVDAASEPALSVAPALGAVRR